MPPEEPGERTTNGDNVRLWVWVEVNRVWLQPSIGRVLRSERHQQSRAGATSKSTLTIDSRQLGGHFIPAHSSTGLYSNFTFHSFLSCHNTTRPSIFSIPAAAGNLFFGLARFFSFIFLSVASFYLGLAHFLSISPFLHSPFSTTPYGLLPSFFQSLKETWRSSYNTVDYIMPQLTTVTRPVHSTVQPPTAPFARLVLILIAPSGNGRLASLYTSFFRSL
jgi:hypothetical protein